MPWLVVVITPRESESVPPTDIPAQSAVSSGLSSGPRLSDCLMLPSLPAVTALLAKYLLSSVSAPSLSLSHYIIIYKSNTLDDLTS